MRQFWIWALIAVYAQEEYAGGDSGESCSSGGDEYGDVDAYGAFRAAASAAAGVEKATALAIVLLVIEHGAAPFDDPEVVSLCRALDRDARESLVSSLEEYFGDFYDTAAVELGALRYALLSTEEKRAAMAEMSHYESLPEEASFLLERLSAGSFFEDDDAVELWIDVLFFLLVFGALCALSAMLRRAYSLAARAKVLRPGGDHKGGGRGQGRGDARFGDDAVASARDKGGRRRQAQAGGKKAKAKAKGPGTLGWGAPSTGDTASEAETSSDDDDESSYAFTAGGASRQPAKGGNSRRPQHAQQQQQGGSDAKAPQRRARADSYEKKDQAGDKRPTSGDKPNGAKVSKRKERELARKEEARRRAEERKKSDASSKVQRKDDSGASGAARAAGGKGDPRGGVANPPAGGKKDDVAAPKIAARPVNAWARPDLPSAAPPPPPPPSTRDAAASPRRSPRTGGRVRGGGEDAGNGHKTRRSPPLLPAPMPLSPPCRPQAAPDASSSGAEASVKVLPVPRTVTSSDLAQAFARYGGVVGARVVLHSDPPHGYVDFSSRSSAVAAAFDAHGRSLFDGTSVSCIVRERSNSMDHAPPPFHAFGGGLGEPALDASQVAELALTSDLRADAPSFGDHDAAARYSDRTPSDASDDLAALRMPTGLV